MEKSTTGAKDLLYTFRMLMIFYVYCIYVGEGKGGGALMHVYVLNLAFSTEPIGGC